jgi:hypothetical protein
MLDDLVRVEAAGDDWVRYRCAEPQHVNPQIVARLAEQRLPIVALAETPRSLEDVYLSIVADERVERGAWSADDSPNGEPTTDDPFDTAQGRQRPTTDDEAIRDTQYATRNTAHPLARTPAHPLTEKEEARR